MRKTKTVNGVLHTYYYTGGRLLREVYGTTILDFFYDANGTPLAMRQSAVGSTNYTDYYYITNLQGDVIRLVDHEGRTAAYYRYDPYGKVIEASGSHANINPLRYRGYYYDSESGLYYCQSRYYDPQICRFINADAFVSTGQGILGQNMFSYCNNNAVNCSDSTGHYPGDGSDPLEQLFPALVEWFLESEEDEKDADGEYTLNAKLKRSVKAVLDNFVLVIGIGLGHYGGLIATDEVTVDIGNHYDLFRVTYYDGQFDVGQYYRQGVEASVLFFGTGNVEEQFNPNLVGPAKWSPYESNSTLFEFGGSAYFFAGGTFVIGFDLNACLDDLYEAWG